MTMFKIRLRREVVEYAEVYVEVDKFDELFSTGTLPKDDVVDHADNTSTWEGGDLEPKEEIVAITKVTESPGPPVLNLKGDK